MLTTENLKNLDRKPSKKGFEPPLRNQEPIQMERSPPRGPPRKATDDYIGNIQSIENIQRQISTDSYGKKESKHVSKKPSGNENIFDLVNKRSSSQNSFRGIELKKNNNSKKLEQIEEDAPPVIQMDAGPAMRKAPEQVKR